MKKGTVFSTMGLLLIAAALCITGTNMLESRRAGESADAVLQELAPQITEEALPPPPVQNAPSWQDHIVIPPFPEEIEYPDYILNPAMEMPTKTVDEREYIGVLSIPALERELPIISEWSYPNLKIAPCRYNGSAYLSNFVIIAHNFSQHFGGLNNLLPGDLIYFTDVDSNEFVYEVAEIETLKPLDVEAATESGYDLTLLTCTIGGRSRVTVRCNKLESGTFAAGNP